MRVALCQINPTVGDLKGNAERILEGVRAGGRADLSVLPELCVCGYPPRDLLVVGGFVEACEATVRELAGDLRDFGTVLVGTPVRTPSGGVANALVALRDGAIIATYRKRLLPTYDVFDEDRYFEPGDTACVIDIAGVPVGLAICEDLWRGEDAGLSARYAHRPDPVTELAERGARVIVAPSASPFVLGKGVKHHGVLRARAAAHGVWVVSVNQVGGNDDLVFDGYSTLHAPDGSVAGAGEGFRATTAVVELDPSAAECAQPTDDPRLAAPHAGLAFEALKLGVADYLRKTGFERAVLGLSGGIDSAVTCAIAVAALGPGNVTGVAMPGPYSSGHSVEDALELAANLRIRCPVAGIGGPMSGFRAALDGLFAELDEPALGAAMPDVAEENLQSRVRGTLMMALSNRTGSLLLTTGNKSELAVGYCTLYGDMNGGLAVLSDCTKKLVYDLARDMNARFAELGFDEPPIPERTIEKPPSAELAEGQMDSDSLPAYDELDAIVARRVEGHESIDAIVRNTGFDRAVVSRIVRLIDVNEYKRRQGATGLKITSVAFGTGRRMPIAQGWRA